MWLSINVAINVTLFNKLFPFKVVMEFTENFAIRAKKCRSDISTVRLNSNDYSEECFKIGHLCSVIGLHKNFSARVPKYRPDNKHLKNT